jgi:arylsulfatase A-like enzyme
MVALVDWMVGQIDQTLSECGLQENTLLVITSDNGARLTNYDGRDYGHKSCGELRGQKADIWEGGHREPFVVRWPGHVRAGTISDAVICLSDLLATCAEITSFPLPSDAGEDSYSMLGALTGVRNSTPVRDAVIHHSGDGMFSVRQDQWKLILGLGSGGFSEPRRAEAISGGPLGQLYNVETDWQETGNLWLEQPDIVQQLEGLLTSIQRRGYSSPRPPH